MCVCVCVRANFCHKQLVEFLTYLYINFVHVLYMYSLCIFHTVTVYSTCDINVNVHVHVFIAQLFCCSLLFYPQSLRYGEQASAKPLFSADIDHRVGHLMVITSKL